MSTLTKAAVFVSGRRIYRDVNVKIKDGTVTVLNGVSNEPIKTYEIVETVKADMAFDATHGDGTPPFRLVTQLGCGCGGQKPYEADPGYSGRLRF